MSHDHGRHKAARHKLERAPGREAFNRPSLFSPAGGDDDDDDADMRRVHILSTLESARRPPRAAPSKMRKPLTTEANAPWQMRVLMGLMAVGILALMTAFVLLVLGSGVGNKASPDIGIQTANALPGVAPIRADRNNPLAALVATPAPPALPPAQQAAIIENLPVDPTAPLTTPVTPRPSPAALTALASTHPGSASAQPTLATGGPSTLSTMPTVVMAEGQLTPGIALAPANDQPGTTAPVNKTTSKPRPKASRDEDVTLLEAVLVHSATRKAPDALNVTDELQRCGQLSGGAAATCRARICVQHPTTPACHQAPAPLDPLTP